MSSIQYESSLAKLFASQVAVEVTRMAMQVCGSYGTMKTLPVERLYRDAKMTEIYVGISEVHRSIIANHLISINLADIAVAFGNVFNIMLITIQS